MDVRLTGGLTSGCNGPPARGARLRPLSPSVDMTADVKSEFRRHPSVRSFAALEIMQHRSSEETEPVTSTVDHADIRGLATTLLVSVGCLPRSRREGLSQPRNAHEGCTITGAASLPRIGVAPYSS